MKTKTPLYDPWLVFSVLSIISVGLLMVASSSIVISEKQYGQAFHYLFHQLAYAGLGGIIALFVLNIKTEVWYKLGPYILIISIALLALVLVPGVGKTVNGSTRWIGFGSLSLQVSEFAKFAVIIYLAGYLVRREEEVRQSASGFIKPMLILCMIAVLLLAEPDFGACVVIMSTALGMMFLAGVRLRQFTVLLIGVVGAAAMLAITSPYRMARLTGFLNPWANQFDSGYQLTQSLIAFGRGGWFGVGLGESVQKLFYLPEAHTDFMFAVIAEELGLIGVLGVILLFVLFVARALSIGRRAYLANNPFSAYVAYGISLWVGIQAVVNIGVNSGLLPTKGLTLPFMSYGGSSMLIMCVLVALLLRIDFETRRDSI